MLFYAIFYKDASNAVHVKKNFLAVLIDAFVNLKKQTIASEDPDEEDKEADFFESVENSELNGPGWVYERIASMSIDLCEDETKSGNNYVELLIKSHQFHSIKTKTIINVEFCVIQRSYAQ